MKSLLHRIRESGAHLRLDDDNQLKISAKKGTISEALIDEIKRNKTEIIDYLILCKDTEVFNSIKPAGKKDHYRLSSSQYRIYVLSQFEEGARAFTFWECFPLGPDLSISFFKQAIYLTIERHEILRTVFREDEKGEIRQWVQPVESFQFDIETIDLDKEPDIGDLVDRYIENDKLKAFDLSTGPLIRACIFKSKVAGNFFYYNMHHIISDGWSMDVLRNDIGVYYDQLTKGASTPLKALPIQYKDYSEWQYDWLGSHEMKTHKQYWLRQLEDQIPLIDLPADKIRPAVKTYNGFLCKFLIGGELSGRLSDQCRQNGGTLFMGLVSNLLILFYKYTGQSDLTIGTPVSGRAVADLENQIGCYINMVALRTRFSEKDTAKQLFSIVREVVAGSFTHQHFPFEKLLEELKIPADLSRSPLFDIMAVLQSRPGPDKSPSPVAQTNGAVRDLGNSSSKYDITFEFEEHTDGIEAVVQFNTDVYEKEFIHQLIGHFLRIMEYSTSHPDTAIMDLEFISQEEKNKLMVLYNNTKRDYDKDSTVIDLFMKIADERPDDIAIRFNDSYLTYSSVRDLSARFCHYLKNTEGVRQGDVVVISLTRSQWPVIALLGVLRAGGVYLPVDVMFPAERVEYIKADSQYKVLINDEKLAAFLNSLSDEGHTEHTGEMPRADQPAYIIYTSGSTGHPKGVEITHRSLVNFLVSMQAAPGIIPSDKLLSITTPSFDISLLELLLPLVSGACLCLCDQSAIQDMQVLRQVMEDFHPTIMQGTPSFWNLLLETGWQGSQQLKILCGGEELNPTLGEKLLAHSAELWNMYGPTETTIWSTINPVKVSRDIRSIGRPINNTMICILDKNLSILPSGAVGEIFIGGDGLSVGYRNKPALTKEKFVIPPFDMDITLYRTGDAGKWLPDGTLQYIGRLDNQVKIRGHRIELSEIDHFITAFEGIKESVTVVDATAAEHKQLVSYFVAAILVDLAVLRNFLRKSLPGYIIPHHFVQMGSIPLTPNGKTDRKRLPRLNTLGEKSIRQVTVPSNLTESVLVEVYKEVLNEQQVGIKDNFFDLGGDSVRAVTVINQLRKKGYTLRISELLKNGTLEDLARLLVPVTAVAGKVESGTAGPGKEIESSGVKMKPGIPMPLSWNQQMYIENGEIADAYASFHFFLTGFNQERFLKAYRCLFEYYPLLRSRIITDERGVFQQIMDVDDYPGTVVFKVCDFSYNRHLYEYITQMKKRRFHLSGGETIRAGVFYKEGEALVYITIHHIITNGHSNLLVRDLFLDAYYNRPMPVIGFNYYDFILKQQHSLLSGENAAQRDFWKDKLEAVSPVPVLSDKEEDIIYLRNYQVIETSVYDRLKKQCAEKKLLLNCLILSFFIVLNRKRTKGEKGVSFQITVDGSLAALFGMDWSGVVGQFVNILPFYIPLGQGQSFWDIVRLVQDAYMDGLMHQEIPISQIDSDFEESHGLSLHQLNEIAYNYVDFSNEENDGLHAAGGKEQCNIAQDPWPKHHSGEIMIKASRFKQEIHLEWEVPCLKSKERAAIRERQFIHELKEIIAENC